VGRDVTVGVEPLLPPGRPSPPRLDPQDRSGTPPSAALGLVCPEDILPAAMASLRDPGTPGGVEPQERGITWSPPAGSSVSWTTEDQRNVEALLGDQPAVILVTPLRTPSPPQPLAVADVPEEGTSVPVSIDPPVVAPQVTGAVGSAGVTASPVQLLLSPLAPGSGVKQDPDDVIIVPDSPARARSPSPVGGYRRGYRLMRQQNLSYLRQLRFWAETVRALGDEGTRLPTAQQQADRRQLVELGDWPARMAGIEAASFTELGLRFSAFYEALLHVGTPR